MNELQTAQLAELLKIAIKDIKKDVKFLGRRLVELRLLKEKKQKDILVSTFNIQHQRYVKTRLKLLNAVAALGAQNEVIQIDFGGTRAPSAALIEMVNDLTAPAFESKELDTAKLIVQQAELKLMAGDLVCAASLVFKSQRLVANESSRLATAALGKKAEKQKKAQDAKHGPARRAMEWVQNDWENDPNRLSAPRAAPTYADSLAEMGWVNPETGEVWTIPTIIDWLRDRAKAHKRATGNKLVGKRAMKVEAKKHR